MPFHRRPSFPRLATAAAALLVTAMPWQSALAVHSIAAAAQVCGLDRYQQSICSGDSVYGSDGTVSYQTAGIPGMSASTTMGFGVFKGRADVSYDSTDTALITRPARIQGSATGSSVDNWVISGGTGQGYLNLTWSIDGTTSSSSSSTTNPGHIGMYDDASMSIRAFVSAQTFGSNNLVSDVTTGDIHGGSGTYGMSGPIAFVFDRPLEITITGIVLATLATDSTFIGPTFAGEAHADFSHTAILTGIQAYDANGTLLSDISITAESGTAYPLSPVPEPASAALMLLGVGALALRAARSRR